jgi:hypothetical protein
LSFRQNPSPSFIEETVSQESMHLRNDTSVETLGEVPTTSDSVPSSPGQSVTRIRDSDLDVLEIQFSLTEKDLEVLKNLDV